MQFNTTTAKIPTWALSFLINGDDSGLEPDEVGLIEKWLIKTGYNAFTIFSPKENEFEYFTSIPEFGLPCNVQDCDILTMVNPTEKESE